MIVLVATPNIVEGPAAYIAIVPHILAPKPVRSGTPKFSATERFFSFVSAIDIPIAVDATGTNNPVPTSVKAEPDFKSLILSTNLSDSV